MHRILTLATLVAVLSASATPLDAQSGTKPGQARNGVDVLIASDFRALAGKRVGLITNHTGITADGKSIVEVFAAAKQFELTTLFSPEHGFDGVLDQANIADATHGSTGMKIHSLYGKTRKPTPEMLERVDVIVFDIQDIGCRFYTYISTMKNAMEAAKEEGKGFVVLDRPNPIGGVQVAGPVLDDGTQSFVGCHTIAVQHGMTVGELARMIDAECGIDVGVEVVQCEGWKRDQLFEATGLQWINPSPNMRTLNQAVLYPGVGLLETTNVSVGRGTDTPFEILGAPWIDARKFKAALDEGGVTGVAFLPVEFKPESSKFEGEVCGGVQILVTDRAKVDAMHLGMVLATTLRRVFPEDWKSEKYARLLCDEAVLEAVRAGKSAEQIVRLWGGELAAFAKRRRGFLIYD